MSTELPNDPVMRDSGGGVGGALKFLGWLVALAVLAGAGHYAYERFVVEATSSSAARTKPSAPATRPAEKPSPPATSSAAKPPPPAATPPAPPPAATSAPPASTPSSPAPSATSSPRRDIPLEPAPRQAPPPSAEEERESETGGMRGGGEPPRTAGAVEPSPVAAPAATTTPPPAARKAAPPPAPKPAARQQDEIFTWAFVGVALAVAVGVLVAAMRVMRAFRGAAAGDGSPVSGGREPTGRGSAARGGAGFLGKLVWFAFVAAMLDLTMLDGAVLNWLRIFATTFLQELR